MTPEHFAYWLQGFVELNKGAPPTPEQWKSITEHLSAVFTKVTPPVGAPAPTVAPIPSPVVYCVTCGAPEDDHPYRHVFVAPRTAEDFIKATEKHAEHAARAARERLNEITQRPRGISSGIFPGRIC